MSEGRTDQSSTISSREKKNDREHTLEVKTLSNINFFRGEIKKVFTLSGIGHREGLDRSV